MNELIPVTLAVARRFVAEHHRHNGPPTGWAFGVGLTSDGVLVGVAMAGRPVSPKIAGAEPRTVEVTRVCTLGQKNANTRLYGAICRAAAALGYLSAITYTLESEGGSSLLAAGFVCEGSAGARPGQTWNVVSRARVEVNLFGEPTIPNVEAKLRWRRDLAPARIEEPVTPTTAFGI